MINFYIDESGSMTTNYSNQNPWFIISIVRVNAPKKLNRLFKYFIKKNYKELMNCPKAERMFKNNKFLELKGSALTGKLKQKFVQFFTETPNIFELFIIKVDNKLVDDNFYKNTARAFNYLLKIAFQYYIHNDFIPANSYINLEIDERNQSTESKSSLEDYLDTQLRLDEKLIEDVKVKYFDSANNNLIQIADVFANLEYSQMFNSTFAKEFKIMKEKGILKNIFIFPKKNMSCRYRKN